MQNMRLIHLTPLSCIGLKLRCSSLYRVLQKELYNGVTKVLRKRLHLKAHELSIVQDIE
jgi:hypothetical protein